jgi:hypothetical protein
MKKNRDNFSKDVIEKLRSRVGGRCSNPDHRVPTTGPTTDKSKINNIGKAAHVTAAASGGPRYDPTMTEKQRKSINNAIWLCGNCADMIDKDEKKYTVSLLHSWKEKAESLADEELGQKLPSHKELSLFRSALFQEPIKGSIPNAVAEFCNLAANQLESRDPRFKVSVAHGPKSTSITLEPKENIPFTLHVESPFQHEFIQKFQGLMDHGQELEITSEAIRFSGSNLLEMIGREKGTLSIQSANEKKAIQKVRFIDSSGEEKLSVDDFVGSVIVGRKSFSFKGATYGGTLELEYSCPMEKGKIDLKLGPNYSPWHGKSISHLPYFQKVFQFYESFIKGHNLGMKLEIEGLQIFSGQAALDPTHQDIKDCYVYLQYLQWVKDIANLLNLEVHYPEKFSITWSEMAEVEKAWRLLFDLPKKTGSQIGEVSFTLESLDVKETEELFKKLTSEGGTIKYVHQWENDLNLLGRTVTLNKLEIIYTNVKGEISIKETTPSDRNIFVIKIHPLPTCQVFVNLMKEDDEIVSTV